MGEKRGLTRVGCCGFALAQAEYFRAFDCVEIDSSFYNLPRLETAVRWREMAPSGFVFTMKAWQVITHPPSSPTYKRTRLDPRDREYCGHFGFNPTIRWAWDQTFAVARALRVELVLFQSPASFRPTKEHLANLRRFFERAKRGKFRLGWEQRGEWKDDLIAGLCDELDLLQVVDPFKGLPSRVGKLRYFRLHGPTGTSHRFTAGELRQLATWCSGRPPTYCFFNNMAMAHDAARFKQMMLGGK